MSAWLTELVACLDLTLHLRRDRIDLVSAHWGSGRCGLLAATLVGRPSIYTEHAILDNRNYSQAEIWLLRRLVSLASSVIAVSEQAKLSVVERLGIPADKVEVVGHAVDFADTREQRACGEKKAQSLRLGTIGNLTFLKGHRYMLEAMQMLTKSYLGIKYIIAGEGPLRKTLEAEVERLGIAEYVQFVGAYRNAELPNLLNDVDVIVIPSISESLGIVALEAMYCGKPVVASAIGGLTEIVKDDETGILVPPCDSVALARAVRQLLENEPLRQRMGQAAWYHARTFTPERVVAETHRVYEAVLQGKGYEDRD
jgi:glycosyltransferase involved in cell wall biosynthesis